MVRDCCSHDYNTGLMLLRPNRTIFARMRSEMMTRRGWEALDQPVINAVYKERIQTLDAKFNVHGHGMPCSEAVVAHYTGRKPASPDVQALWQIRDGHVLDKPNPHCSNLMRLYFNALQEGKENVSAELRSAIEKVPPKAGLDCTISRERKAKCGEGNITATACEAQGCCFAASKDEDVPSCFHTVRAKVE